MLLELASARKTKLNILLNAANMNVVFLPRRQLNFVKLILIDFLYLGTLSSILSQVYGKYLATSIKVPVLYKKETYKSDTFMNYKNHY